MLHAVTLGEGPVPLVLAHCGLASHKSLIPLVNALGPSVSAHLIDIPGHGASPLVRAEEAPQAVTVQEMLALAGEGAHLVGHSYGAAAALRAAVEAPERVRSLTLIEPVSFDAIRGSEAHDRHGAEGQTVMRRVQEGDAEGALRQFCATWSDFDVDALEPGARAGLAARMEAVVAGFPELWGDPSGLFEPGRLERVRCPVLLIEGSETPPVIWEIMDALAERLPKARRVRVEGAGHMVPMTHPEAVAKEIEIMLGGALAR